MSTTQITAEEACIAARKAADEAFAAAYVAVCLEIKAESAKDIDAANYWGIILNNPAYKAKIWAASDAHKAAYGAADVVILGGC